MIEPKDKFAKILSDLEKEIRDPHDLEIAKNKLLEVSMMFIDITNRAMNNSNQYESLSKKIDKMQKSLKRIEEDIYIDEYEDDEEENEYSSNDQMHDNDMAYDEEFEFEIKCPYCNYEFVVGQDADLKDEIECPKCHKEIELDWDDYCDGECDHCASICYDEDLESVSEDTKEASNSIREDENEYNAEDSSKSKNKQNNNSENQNKPSNQENTTENNNQVNENEDDM